MYDLIPRRLASAISSCCNGFGCQDMRQAVEELVTLAGRTESRSTCSRIAVEALRVLLDAGPLNGRLSISITLAGPQHASECERLPGEATTVDSGNKAQPHLRFLATGFTTMS